MSLKKRYLKDKPACKVTFRLEKAAAPSARTVHLVGDFNNWDEQAKPMKKSKNGDFTATLKLDAGVEYQFRYLIDGEKWENDWKADKYAPSHFPGIDNSVITT
ncbi:MAG TPA: glycoside hydrolase [bacterium]|nr:glycoside hydrolase [bacterium]